jgi:hypothetical protein
MKPPVTVIHGSPGVGKSSFGAAAPGAIFIPTEDGLGGLSVDAFPLATTFDVVIEAISLLYTEKHDFKTVVVDSLSALETLIHAKVAKDNDKTSVESVPYGRGYKLALEYWQQFLDGITALRDHKGMTPILIAHSEIVKYDAPDTDSYDRFVISMHKHAMSMIYEGADIIGFATWRTHVVQKDAGFNKKITKGIGTGERLLHLVERPAYIAKNRYGMPETIPLSWDAFIAAFPQPEAQPTKSAKTAAGA